MTIEKQKAAIKEMREVMLKYLPEKMRQEEEKVSVISISVLCAVSNQDRLENVTLFYDAEF